MIDCLFLLKSKQTGKKFRSRNDIRVFMENQGQYDFDPEKFDFCIHRRKRNNNVHRVKHEVTPEVPRKIKTLLPKTKPVPTSENVLLNNTVTNNSSIDTQQFSTSTPTTSATDGGKYFAIHPSMRIFHIVF